MAGRGRGNFNVKGSKYPPEPYPYGRGYAPYPAKGKGWGGKGYKGGPPPGKGGGKVTVPNATPPLPYGTLVRKASEHFARFPHRLPDENLTSVTAHWAGRDSSILDMEPVELKIDTEGIVPTPAEAEIAEDKAINARAMICSGVKEGPGHVLQRISLLARRTPPTPGVSGFMQAYGGLVKREGKDEKKKDENAAQSLAALVEGQCGLKLEASKMRKLVEFRYDGQPPTVFFLADLSGAEGSVSVKPAGTETTEEVEEEEEYEEEEGEGEEKTTVKKTRTVTKEKKTRNEETSPFVTPLLSLLRNANSTNPGQLDLHAAADAMDEWLRRDGALRLAGVLTKKKEEQAVAKKAREERQEEQMAFKRKHEDEVKEVKKARTEEVQKMQAEFKEDCEGLTDGEKKVALVKHREKVRETEGTFANQEKELTKKFLEEERERKQAAAAKAAEEAKTKPKTKKVRVRDADSASLFQVFDRTGSTNIGRPHLAACLLAADDTGSVNTYRELANVTTAKDSSAQGGILPYLAYEELCTTIEEHEIPEEPKPEEKAEEKADGEKAEKTEKMEVDGEVGES